MATEYIEPQWLLPNELNQAVPADGATGSGLAEDRQSLYSMEFDGSNDVIDLGSGTELELIDDFSISVWIKPTGSLSRGIICCGDRSGGSGWFISRTSTDKVAFSVYTVNARIATSTTSVNTGDWFHVIGTFEKNGTANQQVKIYINGNTTAEDENGWSSAQTPSYAGTIYKEIGFPYVGSNYYEGSIDEVAIFSRTLSSDEITTLWNSGSPGNAMILEPTAYYPLGEQARAAGSLAGGIADWQFPNQSLESYAFDFNGTGYATVTPNAFTDFTVSFWINPSAGVSASYDGILGQGTTAAQGGILKYVAYSSNATSGNVSVFINGWTDVSGTVINGVWTNIILTYDSTADELKGYNNGSLYTTISSPDFSAQTTAAHSFVDIGRRNNLSTTIFYGEISNVALWDSASINIDNIYNNGIPQSTYTLTPNSWWKLDSSATFDPATTTWSIPDAGSGSNTGTSTGMTQASLVPSDLQFESPYSNFSLEFDAGSSQYINCGNPTELQITGALTLSAWIKSPTLTGTNQGIIYKDDNTNRCYKMQLAGSSGVPLGRLQFSTFESGVVDHTDGTTNLADDDWHHVVAVYTPSTSVVLYVDGAVQTTNTIGIPVSIDNDPADFEIGRKGDGTLYFDGNIDEVAIWNTALTAAQVTQVYNNGYPRDLTFLSPTSWWRLGEDAYFVSPDFTIPNKISGGVSGVSDNMTDIALVADAPGSFGGGLGYSLDVEDRIGDAKESTANSVSYNMIQANRISYPAGYVPTQVDNDYAMAFDGISTYIDVGTISLGTIFTVSCWVNFNSFSATTGIIFGGGVSYYALYAPNSTTIWAYFGGGSSFTVPALSGWNNLVFTRNGGDGELFLNGVSQGTKTTYGANNFDLNFIGCENQAGGTEYYVDGEIDEAAVFDYVLSANQIQQDIYGGGRAPKCADLNNISNLTPPVAWYRMGD